MLRCAAAALLGTLAISTAQAQASRPFPANALRGTLVVTQSPLVLMNERPARLSPGSRIRGEDNLLVLPGTITGRPLVVHYTLDLMGQLHDVWILTPEERARQPWPATAEQASQWSFDPASQTWSHP